MQGVYPLPSCGTEKVCLWLGVPPLKGRDLGFHYEGQSAPVAHLPKTNTSCGAIGARGQQKHRRKRTFNPALSSSACNSSAVTDSSSRPTYG